MSIKRRANQQEKKTNLQNPKKLLTLHRKNIPLPGKQLKISSLQVLSLEKLTSSHQRRTTRRKRRSREDKATHFPGLHGKNATARVFSLSYENTFLTLSLSKKKRLDKEHDCKRLETLQKEESGSILSFPLS